MEPEYIFALVLLAFVTGIMGYMNPIFLMVLLALVTGLMELSNAVWYYHFVAFPHLGAQIVNRELQIEIEEIEEVTNYWDEFARRVSLQ